MPKHKNRKFSGDPAIPADVSFGAGVMSLAELELAYVKHVLSVVGGNKREAARVLGIDRRSLYRRIAWLAGAERLRSGGRPRDAHDARQLDLPGTERSVTESHDTEETP
jgi:hypothetical protein